MRGKSEFVGNGGIEGDVGMYDCGKYKRNPTDFSGTSPFDSNWV